jgi:hypothetical protein
MVSRLKTANTDVTRPDTASSFASATTSPHVFWVSGPARPDDAVMLVGHGLRDATVEVAALPATDPDQPGTSASKVDPESLQWTPVEPLARDDASLTFPLPVDLPEGLMLCRVRCTDASAIAEINAPDVWWTLGDAGKSCTSGGWLRLHGRCLGMGTSPRVALRRAPDEPWCVLPCRTLDGYALRADLPEPLPAGDYEVCVHNGWGGSAGWRAAPSIEVICTMPEPDHVIDITSLGVKPNSDKDCTPAIVQAMERLHALRGGVLYFPRGRYRVNGGLRSGMWIDHSLRVPARVTLRGEAMDKVSLYWPEREQPLPSLIEGGDHFAVEDMTLYTHGRHRNVISGGGDVRIRRVRIRANCYLNLDTPTKPFRGRQITEAHNLMGTAIELEGDNVEVTDCDILHSGFGIRLKNVRNALVARNTIRHGSCNVMIYGGERLVFEHNRCEGAHLCSTGGTVALFYGATTSRHCYMGHNTWSHIYGGYRETMTLDGHGTAYAGAVAEVSGREVVLAGDPRYARNGRDAMPDAYDMTLYILAGRGAGQYRRVVGIAGRRLTLDREWQVAPDATSIVGVGVFNGRHLFIGNEVRDSGVLVQLYPPNIECIVAENTGWRTGPIVCWGKFGLQRDIGQKRVEPSWFNQMLDNRVAEGNGWGPSEGGVTLWGEQVSYVVDAENHDVETPLSAEELAGLLTVDPSRIPRLAITRWQVVRGQRIDSNATIRVRGAVSDSVIDHPVVCCSDRGVAIDRGPQEVEPDGDDSADFSRPRNIVIRRPQFENVTEPLTGSGLNFPSIRQC